MPRAQKNQPDVIDVTPRASHTSCALATTSAANMPTPERLRTLLAQLSAGIVAREPALKIALLTLLAGENIVLIGPPGTGKSMVSRRVADALGAGDGAYFEYLLTKFSTPEEIFGPLSLAALKNDRFERRTEGYLPSVRVAFLDEIFKASSSILNALLTILNERIYHNGPRADKVPLRALIAASNELPTGQSELAALYDRFLVRHFVGYVDKGERRNLFNAITTAATTSASQAIEPLTAAELTAIDTAARAVTLPAPIVQALTDIWAAHEATFSENRDEHLSDRRMTKVLHLLRVSAATNGRSEVDLSDLMLLHHCLWNHDANREAVHKLITDTLKKHSRPIVLQAAPSAQPSPKTANEVSGVSAALIPTTRSAQPTGQLGARFKYMKGRGTADDPLLIETEEDLLALSMPEVGQKGYHFLQVNNLDLSKLNAWETFDFQGCYDGDRKVISGARKIIFNQILPGSCIKNINLNAVVLANEIIKSIVQHSIFDGKEFKKSLEVSWKPGFSFLGELIECEVENIQIKNFSFLTRMATKTKFTGIFLEDAYFANHLSNCQLSHISTTQPLALERADNCQISDLLMNYCYRIVENESGASHVEIDRALIMSRHAFLGLFEKGQHISIKNTVCIFDRDPWYLFNIGTDKFACEIKPSNYLPCYRDWYSCVYTSYNCFSIQLGYKEGKRDGTTPLSMELFTKRFIETRLGFDVKNVWDCDNMVNGIPQLRFPAKATLPRVNVKKETAAKSQAPTVDLLQQQLTQNIWV